MNKIGSKFLQGPQETVLHGRRVGAPSYNGDTHKVAMDVMSRHTTAIFTKVLPQCHRPVWQRFLYGSRALHDWCYVHGYVAHV